MNGPPATGGDEPSTRSALTLRASAHDVAGIRQRIAGWLDEVGVRGVARSDCLLVASELLTNAAEYGRSGEVSVRVERPEPGRVAIEVISDGGTVPPPDTWEMPPPLARTGRGLGIVKALTAGATVSHVDGLARVEVLVDV